MQHTSPWAPLSFERLALASGPLFAIGQIAATAYFIGQIAPRLPALDAPLSDQAAFYTDYARENALVAFLYVLSVPFFLLFLGGLFGVMRRVEGHVGVLTATAIGAGIALAMVWPIGIVVADAGQGMAARGLQPAAVEAFDSVAQLMLALGALPRAVLLLAASLALRARVAAPGWMSWSGLVLAALGVVGSATLLEANLYPLLALTTLLFDIWVGAAGIILLRRATSESSSRIPQPASLVA